MHAALVALDKLQFVLTTNYDTLLERSFRKRDDDVSVCSFTDAGEVQRRLSRREFFILKAHGDATKLGNKIVLTDVDYRNLLFGQRAYQSLLSAMFTMFTFVFVGASDLDGTPGQLRAERVVDLFGDRVIIQGNVNDDLIPELTIEVWNPGGAPDPFFWFNL